MDCELKIEKREEIADCGFERKEEDEFGRIG